MTEGGAGDEKQTNNSRRCTTGGGGAEYANLSGNGNSFGCICKTPSASARVKVNSIELNCADRGRLQNNRGVFHEASRLVVTLGRERRDVRYVAGYHEMKSFRLYRAGTGSRNAVK